MTQATDAPAAIPARPPREPEPRRAFARRWWRRLQPLREDGGPNPDADRGALARLRRAASPVDALQEEAVFALHRGLGLRRYGTGEDLVRVAVAACVLAGVREDDAQRPLARAVGRDAFADTKLESAAMSPLRLRRLLQAREPDDVLRQMRRAVDLGGRKVDAGGLAVLVLDWLDEHRGERARTRFAYDYYAAGIDLPVPPETP